MPLGGPDREERATIPRGGARFQGATVAAGQGAGGFQERGCLLPRLLAAFARLYTRNRPAVPIAASGAFRGAPLPLPPRLLVAALLLARYARCSFRPNFALLPLLSRLICFPLQCAHYPAWSALFSRFALFPAISSSSSSSSLRLFVLSGDVCFFFFVSFRFVSFFLCLN